jgi:hypothetical protein
MSSEQSPMILPVYPFKGGELDGLEVFAWAPPVDDLGFVEAIDSLGEGVFVAVADAANGGIDAGLDEPLGVANDHVLAEFTWWSERHAQDGCDGRSRFQSTLLTVVSPLSRRSRR